MLRKLVIRSFRTGVLLLFLLFCFGFSCKRDSGEVPISFCYWKTFFHLNSAEDSVMAHLGVNHLYIRLFDVDWNPYENQALPVATIGNWWSGDLEKISITPTIFITNTVMAKCSTVDLDSLAKRIGVRTRKVLGEYSSSYKSFYAYKIVELNKGKNLNRDSLEQIGLQKYEQKVTEILIDCDWTAKTRDSYFYFLKKIKEEFVSYKISSTLRLWQFRDRKIAGIPAVDRCLLMCYSMDSPAEYKVENSICSTDDLAKYVTDNPYPVKLDIALPIYHWAVMFRDGNFIGLIGNINIDPINTDTSQFVSVSANRYRLKSSMVIGNKYFRYGDEIRLEQVSPEELEKMAKYLKKTLRPAEDSRITFFSWDTTYIKQYGEENIKNYCNILLH